MRTPLIALAAFASVALAAATPAAAACDASVGGAMLNRPLPSPRPGVAHDTIALMTQMQNAMDAQTYFYRCGGSPDREEHFDGAMTAVVQIWQFRQQQWHRLHPEKGAGDVDPNEVNWIHQVVHYLIAGRDSPDCLHRIVDHAGIPVAYNWRRVGDNEQVNMLACFLPGGQGREGVAAFIPPVADVPGGAPIY
jgi:hypothetical protein